MGEVKNRRVYDKQFKLDAVGLTTNGGRRVSEVARDLGIEANMLHRWKREYLDTGADVFPGKGHLPVAEEELRRMQRELNDVKEERDILKKALAIFSKRRP